MRDRLWDDQDGHLGGRSSSSSITSVFAGTHERLHLRTEQRTTILKGMRCTSGQHGVQRLSQNSEKFCVPLKVSDRAVHHRQRHRANVVGPEFLMEHGPSTHS
jgi:hypothetical protein